RHACAGAVHLARVPGHPHSVDVLADSGQPGTGPVRGVAGDVRGPGRARRILPAALRRRPLATHSSLNSWLRGPCEAASRKKSAPDREGRDYIWYAPDKNNRAAPRAGPKSDGGEPFGRRPPALMSETPVMTTALDVPVTRRHPLGLP